MNNIKVYIFACLLFSSIVTLGQNSELSNNPNDIVYNKFQMQIEGRNYQLLLTHDEYRSIVDSNAGTITVRLIDNASQDTLYKKTFDFSTLDTLFTPAPKKYWLKMFNSGGGSGFYGTLFYISIIPEVTLQPIFNFNELSFWKYNHDASELILFEGIWECKIKKKNFEGHFSPHRQLISMYKILDDTVVAKKLGITKRKYDCFSNEDVLKQVQENEPRILKVINWKEYN